ncbi:MAG: dihydrofolate reductase family protein [Patescibacteria group bacterium]
MKIILAMVLSLDGKSTKADLSPNLWASVEDQGFFHDLKKKIGTIIVGRKTWEAAGKPSGDGIRRIVMSRETGFALPDDVEEALLVGGSELNAEFFKRKLINEIYLTIEPKIFGKGLPLAQDIPLEVELELINVERLNPQGTLLLHYRVK